MVRTGAVSLDDKRRGGRRRVKGKRKGGHAALLIREFVARG